MFTSALCFSGGFVLSAMGVKFHQIWLLYLGHGMLGGIGLGLGYISPVSTLIKWFPDRPGMATGMAIMGFGGGAMVASPLSIWLMEQFKTSTDMGVWQTFLVMGGVYLCFMLFGVFTVRIPPLDFGLRIADYGLGAKRNCALGGQSAFFLGHRGRGGRLPRHRSDCRGQPLARP